MIVQKYKERHHQYQKGSLVYGVLIFVFLCLFFNIVAILFEADLFPGTAKEDDRIDNGYIERINNHTVTF